MYDEHLQVLSRSLDQKAIAIAHWKSVHFWVVLCGRHLMVEYMMEHLDATILLDSLKPQINIEKKNLPINFNN